VAIFIDAAFDLAIVSIRARHCWRANPAAPVATPKAPSKPRLSEKKQTKS